jgi:hypothetical protein
MRKINATDAAFFSGTPFLVKAHIYPYRLLEFYYWMNAADFIFTIKYFCGTSGQILIPGKSPGFHRAKSIIGNIPFLRGLAR